MPRGGSRPGAGRKPNHPTPSIRTKTYDAATLPRRETINAVDKYGNPIEDAITIVVPTLRAIRAADLWEKLENLGCDPVATLAALCLTAESEGVRRLAASDLLDRLLPRLKAIEHRGLQPAGAGITADALRQSILDRLAGSRARLQRATSLDEQP